MRVPRSAAILVVLISMLSPTSIACINAPEAVVITTEVSYLPSESFTWSATGGIEDEGELEFLAAHWGGIPSPAVGALQLTIRLNGNKGSIDMKANLVVTATPIPGIYAFDGPWVITSGTGTYSGLVGTGMAHIIGRVDGLSDSDSPELGTFIGRIN